MSKHDFPYRAAEKFPPMIILSITNVCNLECLHCIQKSFKKNPKYKQRFMKWEIYKRTIDEIAENKIILLRHSSDGESLLHPDFLKMIIYAKKKGIKPVNLTTNGLLLTEDLSKKLLKTGLDIVDVSLDAFTKKTYEKIRRGSNYNRVLGNVHNFLYWREKINPQTKFMVSIVDQSAARGEIKAFVDYWKPLVDRVLVRRFHSVAGLLRKKGTIGEKAGAVKRWPCPQLWKRVTITEEGLIRFCAEDWYNKATIGDIRKQSIKEVWQGKEYQKLRKLHLTGEYSAIPICSKCNDWFASPWEYGYEYALKKILGRRGK